MRAPRTHRAALVLALTTTLAAPTAAVAGPPLELGAAIGGHQFATDTELGASDDTSAAAPRPGSLWGVRAALAVHRRIGVEAEAILVPTRDDVDGQAATAFGLRAHAVVGLGRGRLRPFVLAGVGVLGLRAGASRLENDVDQAWHWGVGARLALAPRIDLRVDLRHLVVPGRTMLGATHDLELQVGLGVRLGPPPPRVVPTPERRPPPPPPQSADRDRDGVDDPSDACLSEPEDHDGTADHDGCPDLDDDQVLAELDGVEFAAGAITLSPQAEAALDRVVALLAAAPTVHVEVSGHTSADGERAQNLALSADRAAAVADYLIAAGIAAERIGVVGYGPDRPIAGNDAAGRRRNRRIEIRLVQAE